MAADTPVLCALADVTNHRIVTVEARITAVTPEEHSPDGRWAVVALADDTAQVDVRVYPTTYAMTSWHLQVGNRVVVTAEVVTDPAGMFVTVHTIHPIGDPA